MTVHLINFDSPLIFDLSKLLNYEAALVNLDIESGISSNQITIHHKIKFLFLKISTTDDFEKFVGQINPETFAFNGHFIIITENEIDKEKIFKICWKLWIFNVNILHKDVDNYSMYTFMPFSNNSCSNIKPILINSFDPKRMEWTSNNFFPNKFQNLQGCEIKVGSYKAAPGFIPNLHKNGTKFYSGIDVDILKTLSSVLNFKLNFSEKEHSVGYIFKNKTATGLLKYAYTNEVDIIVGVISLQLSRTEYLSATLMIYTDYLVIVIPPPFLINPLMKIVMPFSIISWICILFVVLTACLSIIVLKILPLKYHNYVIGRNIKGSMLNVFNLLLGGSQTKLPSTNFPRFLLIHFLIFTMVMRTLYQSAIFKLLKEDISTIELNTIDEFIEHDFTFVVYESLAARSNGSKFMQNHIVIKLSEISSYFLKTLDPSYKGVVFSYLTMVLSKNNENRRNFTLKVCEEIVLMNQIVFYFTKNFYLVDEINRLIEEMKAAGLIDHIISNYVNMRSINEKNEKQAPTPLNFGHLKGVFEVLLYGLAAATVCFVIELFYKLVKKVIT